MKKGDDSIVKKVNNTSLQYFEFYLKNYNFQITKRTSLLKSYSKV